MVAVAAAGPPPRRRCGGRSPPRAPGRDRPRCRVRRRQATPCAVPPSAKRSARRCGGSRSSRGGPGGRIQPVPRCRPRPHRACGAGTRVTTRPGRCGVPRWSCEPARSVGPSLRRARRGGPDREVGLVDQRTVAEYPGRHVVVCVAHRNAPAARCRVQAWCGTALRAMSCGVVFSARARARSRCRRRRSSAARRPSSTAPPRAPAGCRACADWAGPWPAVPRISRKGSGRPAPAAPAPPPGPGATGGVEAEIRYGEVRPPPRRSTCPVWFPVRRGAPA